jgi:hypothetical protein
MLEKVFGVGAVRSGPYLVAKPSHVGVDVDRTSCPLRCPPPVGVNLAYRVFGSGRFFLALSPNHFGAVTALMGPHTITVRPEPKALRATLPGLITPCGVVPSSDHPFPRVCHLLRQFALL